MTLNGSLISSVLLAVALGLGVAMSVWFLRRSPLVRRVRLSVIGAAIAAGLYIVLVGAGLSQDAFSLKVIAAAGILLATNACLQIIDVVLWGYLVGRQRHVVVPRLLVDVFNVTVLAGVMLLILARLFDVNLTALVVTSTVVSAVIGLSLQDTLGSVIAGLSLQMDRPFTVGDWANINGREGQVVGMNWRTITLRTLDNHHIVISNTNTAQQDIINYSKPTVIQRLHEVIGLPYSAPPGEVKRVLLEALRQTDGVLSKPAPDVHLREYGDSAIIYDIRFWIDDYAKHMYVRDEVLSRIWYAIRRAGLSVPFPIRDVTVRQISEDHELRLLEQANQELFEQLRPLPVFATLSDEQVQKLAVRARSHLYTAGEILVRQGDTGDSLFVIKLGLVRVDVRGEDGRVTTVAHIRPHDFFGEMSLLTGERRSASVIAEGETEVVIVDKSALAEVLVGDFASLEALSQALELRLRESAEKVAAAAQSRPEQEVIQSGRLLARIQGFLGIR